MDLRVYQPGDKIDVIVCLLCDDDHPLLFLDNQIADCCRCGQRVQFRPTCPANPKTCLNCAMTMV